MALTRVEAEAEVRCHQHQLAVNPTVRASPFYFPLYSFHTPQSCPIDEEVDLLDHGRAAAN